MKFFSGKYTSGQIFDNVKELEEFITANCLKFANLVVTDEALAADFSKRIMDISQGRNDFLLDGNGIPGIYCIFNPKDALQAELSNGGTLYAYDSNNYQVHYAFWVNGTLKKKLGIAKYTCGRIGSTNFPTSLRGMDPAHSIGHDSLRTLCADADNGFHLMTNAEWAFLALKAMREGFQPRGNDYYGKSYYRQNEKGAPSSFYTSGVVKLPWRCLTGSGPVSWNLGGDPFSPADMRGNVWEWLSGYRTVGGEIQIIKDNDAALATCDLSAASEEWKAILADGTLVTPGTDDTYKWDYDNAAPASGSASFCLCTTKLNTAANGDPYGVKAFASLVAREGVTVASILKELLIMPCASAPLGTAYMRDNGERFSFVGGSMNSSTNAGLGARGADCTRAHTGIIFGGRRAFIR